MRGVQQQLLFTTLEVTVHRYQQLSGCCSSTKDAAEVTPVESDEDAEINRTFTATPSSFLHGRLPPALSSPAVNF